MYFDSTVLSGIVIVVATIVVFGGMAHFGWRHIKQDIANADAKSK